MEPIKDFHKDAQVFAANEIDDIGDLSVLKLESSDYGYIYVSCWRVNWRDLLRMAFTRKLYLGTIGVQPPVQLDSDKSNVFEDVK